MTDEIVEEVQKIKEHLKELAPEATDVKIKINEKKPGIFESKIRVNLPRKKSLLAFKRGLDPYSSLLKGHQAILKQLFKRKAKPKRYKLPMVAA